MERVYVMERGDGMTDRMREAFEEWAKNKGYDTDSRRYQDELHIWQAGWQARDAEVAELVGALEAIIRHQEMSIKSNNDALMPTTWHIAKSALAKHKQEG